MKMMEKREFYWIQAIVSAATVNVDNIDIQFDGIKLYSEDEDREIEVRGRRNIITSERCSEGVKLDIYILNEGEKLEERIDYLIDEDYEISDVFISVVNKRNGKQLTVRHNELIGEQVIKEVPVLLDPKTEETTSYIIEGISEGNIEISNLIFETIKGNDKLQDKILQIMDIDF